MRLPNVLVCTTTLAILCPTTWAQDGSSPRAPREGQGRPSARARLTPEKAETAWQWQAKSVALELELATDETTKLVEAYVASRKHLNAEVRKARQANDGEDGGRRRGRRGRGFAFDPQLAEAEREALESGLASFMPADQTKKAVTSLGSFSRQWDTMVDTILGFELEKDKTYAAVGATRQYVAQLGAFFRTGDRQAMRQGMLEARENLMDDLGASLSESQLEAFQQATSPRRRGRGGGRRGGGNQQGNQAGDRAQIGEAAPTFALEDSTGRRHALADYKGKIVVLQWINPDCPVCTRVSSTGLVTAMKSQLAQISDNVVHLDINSTHYMEPAVGAEYLKKYKIDVPVLIDRDGKVGRLYEAKTTPHMFVIDTKGVLRYQGAIDDDSYGSKGKDATNYVVQAVRQIVANDTVSPDITKPYGCSVKYAER